MKNICIRPIQPDDNVCIAEIIRKVLREFGADKPGTVFFDPATDDLFQLFSIPGSVYFILTSDNQIMGGAGVFPTAGLPDGCCELVKLYLLPERRGQGLGLKLMEYCFQEAKSLGFTKMYLETMPELRVAIGLYEKAGFTYLAGPMGCSGHFGCDLWMIKQL